MAISAAVHPDWCILAGQLSERERTVQDRPYNPAEVESLAQNFWEEKQTFKVTEDPELEKFYCL